MVEKLTPKMVEWLCQLRDHGPAARAPKSGVACRVMRRGLMEWDMRAPDGEPLTMERAAAVRVSTGRYPVFRGKDGRWLERITPAGLEALAQEKKG